MERGQNGSRVSVTPDGMITACASDAEHESDVITLPRCFEPDMACDQLSQEEVLEELRDVLLDAGEEAEPDEFQPQYGTVVDDGECPNGCGALGSSGECSECGYDTKCRNSNGETTLFALNELRALHRAAVAECYRALPQERQRDYRWCQGDRLDWFK